MRWLREFFRRKEYEQPSPEVEEKEQVQTLLDQFNSEAVVIDPVSISS